MLFPMLAPLLLLGILVCAGRLHPHDRIADILQTLVVSIASSICMLCSARNFHVCLSQHVVAKCPHVSYGRERMLPFLPSSNLSASSEWRIIFPVSWMCRI